MVKITKETPSENGPEVTLDVLLLKKIFYKYKNYLAAVYAVAGPFRTGKYSLQNLLVRYLKILQLAQVTSTSSVFRVGKALDYNQYLNCRGDAPPHQVLASPIES